MVGEFLLALGVWLLERFASWSVLVSLALWWGKSKVVFRPSRLFLLLILGLIEDIAMVHHLGLTSALAISLMMVTWLVARYFQNRQLWWWYGLGLVGEVLVTVIHRVNLDWSQLVFQLICMSLIHWWAGRVGKEDTIYVET
ncbi:MAG TPA: hypothetical protein VN226_10070 [Anaerolineales bacterium]|nr:hypothetical protein [Anaerolineales bacterium]